MMNSNNLDWQSITFENAKSLAHLTALVEQTSNDVSKLARHEAKIDRLVIQNDGLKESIEAIHDAMVEDKKKIKWVYVVATYPKISFAILLLSYTLAIKDVRDAIGIELKPVIHFINTIKGAM